MRTFFLVAATIITLATGTPCQHIISSWTVDDGLPQNAVYSILQTRDGYLWFTTLDGLVRFDGMSFTIFSRSNTKGITSNRFNTLCEDGHGSLWIGTVAAGLFKFSDGRFTRFTLKDGLPDQYVTAIIEDRQGNLWIGTRAGLACLKRDCFIVYTTAEGFSGNDIASIFEDREGNLWVGTYSRGLNRLTRTVVVVYGKRDGLSTDAFYPVFRIDFVVLATD